MRCIARCIHLLVVVKKKGVLQMLKVPDQITRNRLMLADHLELMDPEDFDMKQYTHCIAGHCCKVFKELPEQWSSAHGPDNSIYDRAATRLGLDDATRLDLFHDKYVIGSDAPRT